MVLISGPKITSPFPIPAFFADKELHLDADGAAILSETFQILSLKEMKLQTISAPAEGISGEEGEEENMATMAKVVLQAAQKKLVSQVGGVNTRLLVQCKFGDISFLVESSSYELKWLKCSPCFDSQVQKKAFIEKTVPLIISLKAMLEQRRSCVLKDLMAYLQVTQPLCINCIAIERISVQHDNMHYHKNKKMYIDQISEVHKDRI